MIATRHREKKQHDSNSREANPEIVRDLIVVRKRLCDLTNLPEDVIAQALNGLITHMVGKGWERLLAVPTAMCEV